MRRLVQHPVVLWTGFVIVHFVVGMLGLYGPGLPLGDVTLVYKFWVEHGLTTGSWVGIDTVWVYPIVALVPMLIAYLFGPDAYASTWLSLVMVVDAVAFGVIIRLGRDRRLAHVGWWWLGFLLLLGPVALGRIDSITVPVAIIGILLLASRPRIAAVLLTVAMWIKVWPAALLAAAVVALRTRWTIAISAAVASIVIMVTALLLGAGSNLFSFITQQTGRGLQVESPIATFWMWDAFATHSTRSIVYYDQAILTYQVVGPGAVSGLVNAAGVMTPLLAVVTAALLVFGFAARRRGVPALELLPPLTLVIAGLTQAIYPYLYSQLLGLDFTLLLVLTARNVLYVVLLVWAVVAVVEALRYEPEFAD